MENERRKKREINRRYGLVCEKSVYEETKMYFCYKLIININVKDKHLDILF